MRDIVFDASHFGQCQGIKLSKNKVNTSYEIETNKEKQ